MKKGTRIGPTSRGRNSVTPSTTLGQNVDRERRARGLTFRELGDMAGVAPSQIGEMVRGKITNPSVRSLYGLAVALGIRMEDLMGIPRVDHTTKGRSRARRNGPSE